LTDIRDIDNLPVCRYLGSAELPCSGKAKDAGSALFSNGSGQLAPGSNAVYVTISAE
jgi:hypothetical protein